MIIFGVSILLVTGITNFILLFFQLLTGLHVIKFRLRLHKAAGITLLVVACTHGILAILANL